LLCTCFAHELLGLLFLADVDRGVVLLFFQALLLGFLCGQFSFDPLPFHLFQQLIDLIDLGERIGLFRLYVAGLRITAARFLVSLFGQGQIGGGDRFIVLPLHLAFTFAATAILFFRQTARLGFGPFEAVAFGGEPRFFIGLQFRQAARFLF